MRCVTILLIVKKHIFVRLDIRQSLTMVVGFICQHLFDCHAAGNSPTKLDTKLPDSPSIFLYTGHDKKLVAMDSKTRISPEIVKNSISGS